MSELNDKIVETEQEGEEMSEIIIGVVDGEVSFAIDETMENVEDFPEGWFDEEGTDYWGGN